MATEGITGLYLETREYRASAAFWRSLGYHSVFESDHGSGQFVHPAGGPYVFVAERDAGDTLAWHPILAVADAGSFAPDPPLDVVRPFTAEHWGVAESLVRDPDGREVSLHAPLPTDGSAPA